MIYDLSNKNDVRLAEEYFAKLQRNQNLCEITAKREKRTNNQNRYLHLILAWFGFETGYTLDEVKQDIFKRQICREHFKHPVKVKVFRSTADLDTKEMTKAIEAFRMFANQEMGIYLPEPNEEENLRSLEHTLKMNGIKHT